MEGAEEQAHSVEAALATLLLDDEVAEQLPFFGEQRPQAVSSS